MTSGPCEGCSNADPARAGRRPGSDTVLSASMESVPTSPRLLPWVASILYLAVLASGLYFTLAALCTESAVRTAGFVAVLGFLIGLEAFERHIAGGRAWAAALLAVRLVGFWAVGALECSGFSRI